MEPYPRLSIDTIAEMANMLRRIAALREEDIPLLDELVKLNSYRSGFRRETVSKSVAYSVGPDDLSIGGTGGALGITLTLMASPFDGQTHEFWKVDAGVGAVTIDGNGKNINGSGTLALAAQYDWARIVYLAGEGKWLLQN